MVDLLKAIIANSSLGNTHRVNQDVVVEKQHTSGQFISSFLFNCFAKLSKCVGCVASVVDSKRRICVYGLTFIFMFNLEENWVCNQETEKNHKKILKSTILCHHYHISHIIWYSLFQRIAVFLLRQAASLLDLQLVWSLFIAIFCVSSIGFYLFFF